MGSPINSGRSRSRVARTVGQATTLVPPTFGARLRARRRTVGLSLRVAAGLAGMSPGFLSMLENDQRRLNRVRDIVQLAEVLRLTPGQLMEGAGGDNWGDHWGDHERGRRGA